VRWQVEQIAGLEIVRLAVDEEPDGALMYNDELIVIVAVRTVVSAGAILPGKDAVALTLKALPQCRLRVTIEFALLKR
jgi:hypothetical protein